MDANAASDRLTRILDEVEGLPAPSPAGQSAAASGAPDTPPSHAEAAPPTGASPPAGMDPALLTSVLPTLLSVFGGLGGGGNGGRGPGPGAEVNPSGGASPPPPSGRAPSPDRHTALICALKPYLGERRQATAETVLKLCRLWDALGRAGITPAMLSGLLGGGTGALPAEPPAVPLRPDNGEVS